MHTVKIQYTVKPEFAEQNKDNIRKVIQELKALGDTGVQYNVYVKEDKKTFVHIASATNGQPGDVIGKLEAFQTFRKGHEGNLETPPSQEVLQFMDGTL